MVHNPGQGRDHAVPNPTAPVDGHRDWVSGIEETFIAATLGLMTLVAFCNVVARYVFNANILWALETTVYLFAWLVLLGASYGVKRTFHIGIDIGVNFLPPVARKWVTLLAGAACIAYAALLLKGSWDYWSPFIFRRAYYETSDLPMPFFLEWMGDVFNDGEAYSKLPKMIPYFALPLGMSLLLLRFCQAVWRVATNRQDLLIAAHEAEEVYEAADDAVAAADHTSDHAGGQR